MSSGGKNAGGSDAPSRDVTLLQATGRMTVALVTMVEHCLDQIDAMQEELEMQLELWQQLGQAADTPPEDATELRQHLVFLLKTLTALVNRLKVVTKTGRLQLTPRGKIMFNRMYLKTYQLAQCFEASRTGQARLAGDPENECGALVNKLRDTMPEAYGKLRERVGGLALRERRYNVYHDIESERGE